MSAVLAAALLAPQVQHYKAIDIDRFDTPYTVQITKEWEDLHTWYGLKWPHCLFSQRSTNIDIGSNPHDTVLTFSLGPEGQKVTSPLEVAYTLKTSYYMAEGPGLDLSKVDRIYVDFYTISPGRTADVFGLSIRDRNGKTGGNDYWQGQPKGIFFKRSEFSGGVDWSRIEYLDFRQDFIVFPNPTTYCVTRFYVTMKPAAVPPASSLLQ
ncbi:MAG: hypothetical protein JST30_17205 [Armatimonadetes bacterium]|nr:hypothetical protein [Armatimonadota bacterium]